MIRYALVCDEAHEFESWFASAGAYDEQARRGFVTCPYCNSPRVEKAIMAPNVARRDRDEASSPAPAPTAQPAQEMALVDSKMAEVRAMVRALREKIMEHTTDVGAAFPEEARKIHDGESEARPIRGQASWDEARALIEDGVEIMPIPPSPDERN
ncbi:MAG TPA: DUF1178 family protein [Rhodoblastus sp.]|nr:DUF1178 family protein [Rhodoblastus sp.]